MTYPTDITAWRDALQAWSSWPAGLETQIEEAMGHASVVVQTSSLMKLLIPRVAELDAAGLRVLAGAAHLIVVNGWMGLSTEALAARDAARDLLALETQ